MHGHRHKTQRRRRLGHAEVRLELRLIGKIIARDQARQLKRKLPRSGARLQALSLFRASIADLVPCRPGRARSKPCSASLGLERVVKLASNEGPFPPFPAALEAMARGERETQPLPGRWRVRACVRRSPSMRGVAFEEVIVGSGADGIIDLLSQATLDPGDDIVCGWP